MKGFAANFNEPETIFARFPAKIWLEIIKIK